MGSKYWTSTNSCPTRGELKLAAKHLTCPRCEREGMSVRWSKEQPFFGCAEYPECRGSRNWLSEVGFPEETWIDPLKAEGKIDPNTPPPPRNQETSHDWKQQFIEERAFVMQQLSDVKAAYTRQLHEGERRDREIKALKKRVDKLQGESKDDPEDDIPF